MLITGLLTGALLVAMLGFKSTPAAAHMVPFPCDFTTGGGFIFVSQSTSSSPLAETGQKANFGLVGGCKNGGFFGHVNYVDHNNGLHVSSDTITAYVNPCPGCSPPDANNARDICGTADVSINGSPVPGTWGFRVRTIDAEQQSSPPPKDKFGIHIHSLDSFGNAGSTAYLVLQRREPWGRRHRVAQAQSLQHRAKSHRRSDQCPVRRERLGILIPWSSSEIA